MVSHAASCNQGRHTRNGSNPPTNDYPWDGLKLGSKFWACLAKSLLFHHHVQLRTCSVCSSPGSATLTCSSCPPSSSVQVVTMVPGGRDSSSTLEAVKPAGEISRYRWSSSHDASEPQRNWSVQSSKNMVPCHVSRAHKVLTNHHCLFYLLISPLPYLATSFLNPGFSSLFPSQFWVLFLPGWSSARSSLHIPCPHSRLCPVSLQHLVSGWAPRSLQIYGSPALPSLRRRFLLSCPRLPGRGAEPRNWEEQPVSTSHQESRALALETQGGNTRLASYLVGSLNVSV